MSALLKRLLVWVTGQGDELATPDTISFAELQEMGWFDEVSQ